MKVFFSRGFFLTKASFERCLRAYGLLFILIFSSHNLFGTFEPTELGYIHEAYISKDSGPVEFDAIEARPPVKALEQVPEQAYPQAKWIPGYWAWENKRNDFIWISGVMRVPPPEMEWIEGEWSFFDDIGWAWIRGFWSSASVDKLTYIEDMPPDPMVENPGFPESSNYFWNPGFWRYNTQQLEYEWVGGSWELLDPNWVLVPAHYEWRSEGYVFISAYWDWPLERRGVLYIPLVISKSLRNGAFTPLTIVEEAQMYQWLIVSYPNYLHLCHHIYHYHPDIWISIAPTWWQWHSWWSLPWHNQWALWWWYTHPGYPAPAGLTPDISERIRPANPRLMQLMDDVKMPFVVTSKGVVPPSAIFDVIRKERKTGKNTPVIPEKAKLIEKIKEEALKETPKQGFSTILEQEIEPSKRGRLHGLHERAARPEQAPETKIQQHPVKLPRKPTLIPGDHKEKQKTPENEVQPVKEKAQQKNTSHLEIRQIPVKELKESRQPPKDRKMKSKAVPPPDPSIIHQVLPGPRVGPPIEFGKESPKTPKINKKEKPAGMQNTNKIDASPFQKQ